MGTIIPFLIVALFWAVADQMSCFFTSKARCCQGKTRIQLQVQLKSLLRSRNTKLGQSRGPEAVIQGKENKQEQGISPIRPPVTPRGREGKALGDQRPQSKRQSRRNVRVGSVQYTESVMTQRQSWKLPF